LGLAFDVPEARYCGSAVDHSASISRRQHHKRVARLRSCRRAQRFRPSRVAVVRYLQALKDSRSLAHPALTGGVSKGTKRLVTSRETPLGFGSTAIDCGTRTSTNFGSAGVVTMDLSNARSPKVTSSKLRSRRPLRVYILPSNTRLTRTEPPYPHDRLQRNEGSRAGLPKLPHGRDSRTPPSTTMGLEPCCWSGLSPTVFLFKWWSQTASAGYWLL